MHLAIWVISFEISFLVSLLLYILCVFLLLWLFSPSVTWSLCVQYLVSVPTLLSVCLQSFCSGFTLDFLVPKFLLILTNWPVIFSFNVHKIQQYYCNIYSKFLRVTVVILTHSGLCLCKHAALVNESRDGYWSVQTCDIFTLFITFMSHCKQTQCLSTVCPI